jgi:hypothetical protein
MDVSFRYCSNCGKVIVAEGYSINGGCDYYCSDECLYNVMSEEEYNELYDDGEGESYRTDWDDSWKIPSLWGEYTDVEEDGNDMIEFFKELVKVRGYKDAADHVRRVWRPNGECKAIIHEPVYDDGGIRHERVIINIGHLPYDYVLLTYNDEWADFKAINVNEMTRGE